MDPTKVKKLAIYRCQSRLYGHILEGSEIAVPASVALAVVEHSDVARNILWRQ
jgi:hypothetical protein